MYKYIYIYIYKCNLINYITYIMCVYIYHNHKNILMKKYLKVSRFNSSNCIVKILVKKGRKYSWFLSLNNVRQNHRKEQYKSHPLFLFNTNHSLELRNMHILIVLLNLLFPVKCGKGLFRFNIVILYEILKVDSDSSMANWPSKTFRWACDLVNFYVIFFLFHYSNSTFFSGKIIYLYIIFVFIL